jgi:hypothetical protein
VLGAVGAVGVGAGVAEEEGEGLQLLGGESPVYFAFEGLASQDLFQVCPHYLLINILQSRPHSLPPRSVLAPPPPHLSASPRPILALALSQIVVEVAFEDLAVGEGDLALPLLEVLQEQTLILHPVVVDGI